MRFAYLLLPLLAISCTSLPNPYAVRTSGTDANAMAVLKRSAAAHGDPWERVSRVEVTFDGKWSSLATRIQPTLTDPTYRESSVETYVTGSELVSQTHTGSAGTKTVLRKADSISVSYNGKATEDPGKLDAAALVADAYTIFLFGSSWLADNAFNVSLLPSKSIDGEPCQLVSGSLMPGLGESEQDNFIAWIAKESGHLKRFQFTMNGLDSTKGADVDVTFLEVRKASDGTVWPTHFIERVRRPVNIKAHEWRTTALVIDGKKMW